MKKYLINLVLASMILAIVFWIVIEYYQEKKIEESDYESQKLNTTSEQTNIENKEYPKEEIDQEYKGYEVCAKLEIPAISLETDVLKTYSTEALKISVTKFWGADPNTVGNFCIAGHNFKNKNMFSNLKELEIGDNLFIIDNEVGRVEYEIYNIYKVNPEDITCLNQDTNNQKEVTLITCTNDSSQRIIVKAREKA